MGSVGTGKSSFLSAMLAELKKESGVIALTDLDGGEIVRSTTSINHGIRLQRFGYNLKILEECMWDSSFLAYCTFVYSSYRGQ
jgi:mannose/fructose-specific phosphotransferase system component IIA